MAPAPEPSRPAVRSNSVTAPDATDTREVLLATAVFVAGTGRLEPGRRYEIAMNATHLRIVGPTDLDPTSLVLERPVDGLEARAVEGRLVLSEPGTRTGLVLAFMAISGTTTAGLADTINRSSAAPLSEDVV